MCATAGAEVRRVPTDPVRGLDLAVIARAAGDTRAKLVWICDPNNPTGRRLELRGVGELPGRAAGRRAVVADEAYVDYVAARASGSTGWADIRAGRRVIDANVLQDLRAGRAATRLSAP